MYKPPKNLHVKVRIYNDEISFGKGIAQLLELVEEHGSLSAAYKSMGMSSSKVWKHMQRAERDLGYPLLKSVSGGAHGGGTEVTPEGRELLRNYRELNRRVQEFAAENFAELFKK